MKAGWLLIVARSAGSGL